MNDYALGPFAACIGDGFELVDASDIVWTLIEAEGHGPVADPATQRSFSLLFRGAADPVFAQQMVALRHPTLGEQAIFVTPIAQDADGVIYQAVFN